MADLTQFEAKQRVLASYEEARSVATFSVKTPAFLPSALSLARIVYVLPPWLSDDYKGTAGFIDFVYWSPQTNLVITQGYTSPLDARGAPPGRSGETRVNGGPATWIDGYLAVDEPIQGEGPENNPTAKWQSGRLTLCWRGDGLISYRLTSEGLSLEQLTQVAESLQ